MNFTSFICAECAQAGCDELIKMYGLIILLFACIWLIFLLILDLIFF